MTLTHYLAENAKDKKLALVIEELASASKQIVHAVQRSGLLGLHGAAGGQNVHSDEVQKLDEFSNEAIKNALSTSEHVLALASEEEADMVNVSAGKNSGFVVAFDPLDGSSNIDVNMPVGTIFSILPAGDDLEASLLQPADKQLAAGYWLYSSSTVMVFSLGKAVVEFTLDPETGDFVLTNDNIRIPKNAGYISYNSANLPLMEPGRAKAYKELLGRSGLSIRYVGAMVGDVHRTLLKGGFFAYPAVGKKGKYQPKLRLQYEGKPLGWLIERAGGKALLDGQPINNLKPKSLHQKVAIEFGDAGVMKLLAELI